MTEHARHASTMSTAFLSSVFFVYDSAPRGQPRTFMPVVSTNSLVSRCLSEYHHEAMQDAGSPEAAKSFQEILADMVNDGATAVATVPFEGTLHTMDAAFSYTIGVFTGLQDTRRGCG
jgi:hypothetical protein